MTLALLANRSLHRRWPGGWSPKELGTLSAWWDADDATTVTISTGVSQWDDKSGNGYHFTQGTGSAQPTYTRGAQNGRAVLRFDGSNDQMSAGDVLDIGTGSYSIVGAFKNNNYKWVLAKSSGGVNVNGEWTYSGNSAAIRIAGTTTEVYETISNTTKILAWVLDRSSGNYAWRNGQQDGNSSYTGSPFPNTDDINTAYALILCNAENDNWRTDGDMFEFILSKSALSTGDRQKCEGYLAHKWGLTSSLPADHPYKSIAP